MRFTKLIRYLRRSALRLEKAAEELENLEEVADQARNPTPILINWWAYMRRESWVHVKMSLRLWWAILVGDMKK